MVATANGLDQADTMDEIGKAEGLSQRWFRTLVGALEREVDILSSAQRASEVEFFAHAKRYADDAEFLVESDRLLQTRIETARKTEAARRRLETVRALYAEYDETA